MNGGEFKEWIVYHCGPFPAIRNWIDSQDNPQVVWEAWQRVLAPVPLDAAKKATDALADGTEAAPNGYSRHPQAVRAIARRYMAPDRVFAGGVQTVKCPHCEDSGLISVLHWTTIERAREVHFDADRIETVGEREKIRTNGMTVLCGCQPGRKGWRHYDNRRDILLDVSADFDTVWGRIEELHANQRHEEFADWQ